MSVKCARQSLPSLPLLHDWSVMAHETKSTHRYIGCSWLRNVSTTRTKLPEELGVVKTTAAQTKPPKGGLSFGWTEFKMHYHCCEFKMAVFLHISTELKWLQIQRYFFVCYTFMSVSSLQRPTVANMDTSFAFYWHLCRMERLGSWMQQRQIGPHCSCNATFQTCGFDLRV